jgi:hypothetical protein
MAEEPLLIKTITCPSCEQKVPFRIANPRLYSVESRESDRHVTGYRWINGIQTRVVPHHYRIWQCANCLFAEFTENVEPAPPAGKHDTVRRAFQDIPIEKQMVLKSLRELVPEGELDLPGAVAIHLAALLVHSLPPGRKQDHAKLGQIAIRLAWLFREQAGAGGPALPPPSRAMAALVASAERLTELFAEGEDLLREIQRQGQDRGDELGLPAGPDGNPYLAAAGLMAVRLDALKSQLDSLQMALLQDRQGRMAPAAPRPPDRNNGLVLGLAALQPLWPDLPGDEALALRAALAAFEYSHEHEVNSESEEQTTVLVTLILEILVRLGEYERAYEWTAQASRYASDTRSDLQARISAGKSSRTLSNYDETVINRKIGILGFTQQKVGERRREILDLILVRDQERIAAILRPLAKAPIPDQLRALGEAGIHDGVVALLSRDLPAKAKDTSFLMKALLARTLA